MAEQYARFADESESPPWYTRVASSRLLKPLLGVATCALVVIVMVVSFADVPELTDDPLSGTNRDTSHPLSRIGDSLEELQAHIASVLKSEAFVKEEGEGAMGEHTARLSAILGVLMAREEGARSELEALVLAKLREEAPYSTDAPFAMNAPVSLQQIVDHSTIIPVSCPEFHSSFANASAEAQLCVVRACLDKIGQMLATKPVTVNFKCTHESCISRANDGRLTNALEHSAKNSRGDGYIKQRVEIENTLYFAPNVREWDSYKGATEPPLVPDARLRPIYGSVHFSNSADGATAGYGNNWFALNGNTEARKLLASTDSMFVEIACMQHTDFAEKSECMQNHLGMVVGGTPVVSNLLLHLFKKDPHAEFVRSVFAHAVLSPDFVAASTFMTGFNYIEAEVFGGVYFHRDIHSVHIQSAPQPDSPAQRESLENLRAIVQSAQHVEEIHFYSHSAQMAREGENLREDVRVFLLAVNSANVTTLPPLVCHDCTHDMVCSVATGELGCVDGARSHSL